MVTILVPFLVSVLGLLVYALATNGKVQEAGRIAYGCGLLVTLLEVAGKMFSFLR